MYASKSSPTRLVPTRLLGLLLAFTLAGCATSPNVQVELAPDVNLARFTTFSFVSELSTNRAGYHTLISQQLVFSTRREMEVRGFRFVEEPDSADLLINFYVDVEDRFRVRRSPDRWTGTAYWDYRTGTYQPWPGHIRWPAHTQVEVDRFTEGRLSVDIIDRQQNMLVWEGLASQRVTQRTLNDLGPALDNAIHRLFRDFPVAPTL